MTIAKRSGRVRSALAHAIEASLPSARVGEPVVIRSATGMRIPATVVSVERGRASLATQASVAGVAPGDVVESVASGETMPLGTRLLGRAIAPSGEALDALGAIAGRRAPVVDGPISAADREPIDRPFWTGVRAIDGLATIGRGARIGIFGGPATGKSSLLETIVSGARADAIVVGLIGERGREAAAWIARIPAHATIVCAPSDRPAAERVRAAHVALAQASQLRRRGLNVLVVLDSVARFAAAAREVAVRAGEATGRGGYPPSVFAELGRLLERGGNVGGGSITLIATVLSDGADEREPLSEAAMAALDGHVVLSTKLARAGLYPAIDVVASASRTMNAVVAGAHAEAAHAVRRALARLEATRELRELGFSQPDPQLDRAVALQEHLEAFVHHGARACAPRETLAELARIAERLGAA